MRKIIAGRKYDTDTATFLGSHDNGLRGFDWSEESLYRKKSGEYFLHGEGGARTEWARMDHGLVCGGEGIRPITYEGARMWAEDNLSADLYEAAFGPVPEDAGDAMLSVRVSAAAKAALDREVSRTGRTAQAVVSELLEGLRA